MKFDFYQKFNSNKNKTISVSWKKRFDQMKKNYKILIYVILFTLGLVILFGLGYLYVPLLPPQNLTGVEITLERTPCYGTCPVYSIIIHGDGTVIYEGKQFVRIEGTRVYTIPKENVEELVGMFYEINYFSLNDRYDASVTDLPTVITSIKVGNETKTVSNYANAGPSRLHDLELTIDQITDSQSLWKK